MKGISTNRRTIDHLACLRQAGIQFIARYYSTTTQQSQKRLTLQEAQAISAAGISIVAVYEDGPTSIGYFSASRGHLDGVNAYHTAMQLHQPKGSAIYFTVDYDATPLDIAHAISDYFKGVKQGFADAAQGGEVLYEIGVYGSGSCCNWLKQHVGLAKYTWLAESTGWSGSQNYSGWDIKQSIANHDLCTFSGGIGGSYEDNATQPPANPSDIGAFTLLAPSVVLDAVNDAIAAHAAMFAADAPMSPPAPVSGSDGWKALFKMKLKASDEILEGTFTLTNGVGATVIEVQATSGTKGHQKPTDIWAKNLGPLPPNPSADAGNKIETLERSTPIISREFRIRPEEVKKPGGEVTRDAFRVHQDGGAPGSAGCIAISSPADFEHFAQIMHDLLKDGVQTIPLQLKYS